MVDINYGAVVVAALVQIALGWAWYGPLFGKAWMSTMGSSEERMKEKMKDGAGMSYLVMTIGTLLMSWVLAIFITSGEAHYGIWTASYGIHIALYLWLGFVAPLTVSSVLWEGKPWKFWFLSAGYYFVGLILMGAILGAWH